MSMHIKKNICPRARAWGKQVLRTKRERESAATLFSYIRHLRACAPRALASRVIHIHPRERSTAALSTRCCDRRRACVCNRAHVNEFATAGRARKFYAAYGFIYVSGRACMCVYVYECGALDARAICTSMYTVRFISCRWTRCVCICGYSHYMDWWSRIIVLWIIRYKVYWSKIFDQ